MQTKVLCVLFLAATTSASLIPPLIGRGILNAGSALLNGDSSSSDSSSQEDSGSGSQGLGIPQLIQNPLSNAVNLGLHSPQLVKKVIDSAQQWVDETLRSKKPSTTAAPSSTIASSSTSEAPSTTSEAPSSSSSPSPDSTTPRNRRQTRSANHSASNITIATNISAVVNPDALRNLSAILSSVNFKKLAQSVPKIPPVQNVSKLPDIPGLREGIRTARRAIARALDGISDFQTAIQNSVEKAIKSFDPNAALNNILRTIIQMSTLVAKSLPLAIAGAFVIQDGIQTAATVVNTIVNAAGLATRFLPFG